MLSVMQPVIFAAGDGTVEDCLETLKVYSMVFDVQQPLWLVPSHHPLIVSTKNRPNKEFVACSKCEERIGYS